MDWIELQWFRWRFYFEPKTHPRCDRPLIPYLTVYIEPNKPINNHDGVNITVFFESYWFKCWSSYNEGLPIINCTDIVIFKR